MEQLKEVLRTAAVGSILTLPQHYKGIRVRVCHAKSEGNSPCTKCVFSNDKRKAPKFLLPPDYREFLREKLRDSKPSSIPSTASGHCPYLMSCTSPNRADGISVVYWPADKYEAQLETNKEAKKLAREKAADQAAKPKKSTTKKSTTKKSTTKKSTKK